MEPAATYRCRLCGAPSYRKLTHRGLDGTMEYSGLYRCSGCSVTFSDPAAWRDAPEVAEGAAQAAPIAVRPGPPVPPLRPPLGGPPMDRPFFGIRHSMEPTSVPARAFDASLKKGRSD
jgi:DNA-directed RNA polymerase subunit RPC12/RpoP